MHNGVKWLADAGYGDIPDYKIPAEKLPLDKLLITYHPKMSYSTSVWPVNAAQRADLESIIPGGFENQAWFYAYIAMPKIGPTGCAIGRLENNQGKASEMNQNVAMHLS